MLAATGDLATDDVWLLWDGNKFAGYVLARISERVLMVENLLFAEGVTPPRRYQR